jgi:hypothetical protein
MRSALLIRLGCCLVLALQLGAVERARAYDFKKLVRLKRRDPRPPLEQLQQTFAPELQRLRAKFVIGTKDLEQGRATLGRIRGTKKRVFVFEGAKRKHVIEGIDDLEPMETTKRPVFLFAKKGKTLHLGKRGPRVVPIDELPRPQDRHEIIFDLDDGRVLLAFEFASLVTKPTPEHMFSDGRRFGPAAMTRLTETGPRFRRDFFRTFGADVQVLMNHIMHVFPREGFEKAQIYRLRSQRTGESFFLMRFETDFFGTKLLFFAERFANVARDAVLRDGQVSLDHTLGNFDFAKQGNAFVVEGTDDSGVVGQTATLGPKAFSLER